MTKREQPKNKIRALSPRQFLIKRINVYFGQERGDENYPYSTQKSILVREIQDNAIDALTKFSNRKGRVRVTFEEDGSVEVYDSGPGFPVGIGQTPEGKPASELYLAMGTLNAGSNYDDVTDSIGTNGVGGSGAQMLSEYMIVEVYKDKKCYQLHFQDSVPGFFDDKGKFTPLGKDLTKLLVTKDNRSANEKKLFPTGSKVKFKVNQSLLKSPYPFDIEDIKARLKGLSFLEGGIHIEVVDNFSSNKGAFEYNYGGGLANIVNVSSSKLLTNIHEISEESTFIDDFIDIDEKGNTKSIQIEKSVKVSAAFAYQNNYDYTVDSYVNTVKTRLGGVHTQAFEKALVNVFNSKLQSMRGYLSKNEKNLPIYQDYAEGLNVAISVSIPEPDWTSQIKEEIGGKKALKEFTRLFTVALQNWVDNRKNAGEVKVIADKVIEAWKVRCRRKEEIDLQRERKAIERSSKMPIKLVDCSKTYDDSSELFIVEGDSALSGVKEARNSEMQALLPIRGKIINAVKSTLTKVLQNEEVSNIIKCLDAGFGQDFDTEKLRYKSVFITTDADPDGAAIANLLIGLFWTLMPQLIQEGRLYRVLTPLFIIKTKGETFYCLNKQERDIVLNKIGNQKYTIIRAKGLGETGADVLKITGMDPATRRVERIVIDDVARATEMIDVVMSEDADKRKQWLYDNPIEDLDN